MTYKIFPLKKDELNEVKAFCDQWIGTGYFSLDELKKIYEWGIKNDLQSSLIARDLSLGEIVGVRLTYAPGEWIQTYQGNKELWQVPPERVAQFKSLFVSAKAQGKGLGIDLSTQSLEVLKKMGAKAVICFSWLESPGNSSQRYLEKLGLTPLVDHPKFWYDVDYLCTRCRPNRCVCTAREMIKYLT